MYKRQGDYSSFVREELRLRQEFAFPPYINIINVCIISRDESLATETAQSRYNELFKQVKERFKGNELLLYRPVPHSIYRINDEYRLNLFMKASNSIMPALREIIREVYMSKDIMNIKVSININTDTV